MNRPKKEKKELPEEVLQPTTMLLRGVVSASKQQLLSSVSKRTTPVSALAARSVSSTTATTAPQQDLKLKASPKGVCMDIIHTYNLILFVRFVHSHMWGRRGGELCVCQAANSSFSLSSFHRPDAVFIVTHIYAWQNIKYFKVYRWDPEQNQKPYLSTYPVDLDE